METDAQNLDRGLVCDEFVPQVDSIDTDNAFVENRICTYCWDKKNIQYPVHGNNEICGFDVLVYFVQ